MTRGSLGFVRFLLCAGAWPSFATTEPHPVAPHQVDQVQAQPLQAHVPALHEQLELGAEDESIYGIDTCSNDEICDKICEIDFMVYEPSECMQDCHEDADDIWEVIDSYCDEDLSQDYSKDAVCGQLCNDGFDCGGATACEACERKCHAEFGLVMDIYGFCANCDGAENDQGEEDPEQGDEEGYDGPEEEGPEGEGDYDGPEGEGDYGYGDYDGPEGDGPEEYDGPAQGPGTSLTMVDKCDSNSTEKCKDSECWCAAICEVVICEEPCNDEKLMPIFDSYCTCGLCEAQEVEEAGLLHVKGAVKSIKAHGGADASCSCKNEEQYCGDVCTALGYIGDGLADCRRDCAASKKLPSVLKQYCVECSEE